MEKLNYEVLKKSGYQGYILENAPEKILQFGEGNFLRAFVDYWFDMSNEKAGFNGKAVLVQPIAPGLAKQINEQQGLYTLYLRGRENGEKVDRKRVISSVSRCRRAERSAATSSAPGARRSAIISDFPPGAAQRSSAEPIFSYSGSDGASEVAGSCR